MAGYHKYVFDVKNRKFVGAFDEMYSKESTEGFDSWHQDDTRQLNRLIALNLIDDYNFSSILDIGCGKGTFTHNLKKKNNYVLGLDISQTAISNASMRYPDIEFKEFNVDDIKEFADFIENEKSEIDFDLVFIAECLSYLKNWKTLIEVFSKISKYLCLTLFLPADPIGFVKSPDHLIFEIEKYFDIHELVTLQRAGFVIIFASVKTSS